MKMTDLAMTKRCAQAMDVPVGKVPNVNGNLTYQAQHAPIYLEYDPLHDDAQAMALVKKLRLSVGPNAEHPDRWWTAWTNEAPFEEYQCADAVELNRAIVECVARIQAAKR